MTEPNPNDKDAPNTMAQGSEIVPQSKSIERPRHSRPYRVFKSNIKSLRSFIDFMAREQRALKSEVKELASRQIEAEWKEVLLLKKKVSLLERRADEFLRAGAHMWIWQPVHLVTFIETYLQDVLADAAALDPSLMAESAQTATYNEVTSSHSVQSLAQFIRHRWARNWVDSGGPKYLLARLDRMGAKGFPEGADAVLEEMWGVRHVVVHRSGLATRDFVERHPTFGARPGKMIKIPYQRIQLYLAATTYTIQTIDEYATNRWPGLVRPARVRKGAPSMPPGLLSD